MIEMIISGLLGVLISAGFGAIVTLKVKSYLIEKRMNNNPLLFENAKLKVVRNKATGADLMTDCIVESTAGRSIELLDKDGRRVWLTNNQFDGYEIVADK